ncbi:MAG TPA: LLM class flavin-dependent oxidoreductase [Candidatus Binataceae bacterium]|nr:LLM class flavin-dependent oxidoreductase [Candidatus Binataceae bacterium]
MKFGVLQFFSWPDRRVAMPVVYERALGRIEIMDRSGYDAVWITEHHFNDYSVCPSIPVMGAYAAARTKNLHIATGVTLAAFYHPLRLAEEIALLDILSGGRVYWGAGRGFDPKEFRTFGMTPEESYPRFRESVDVVMRAWQNQRVSYQGKYFSFENVEVLPKPLQQPHPPMWVAAYAPTAIEWAAEQGYSIMLDPHSPTAMIDEKMATWRELMTKYGHSIEGRVLPTVRLTAIADTDAKAAAIAREGSRYLLRTYVNPQGERGESDAMAERYVDQMVIHGTAERVVEKIRTLHEEIGLDYMITAPLSHETFLAFTDKVLPQLATTEPVIAPSPK